MLLCLISYLSVGKGLRQGPMLFQPQTQLLVQPLMTCCAFLELQFTRKMEILGETIYQRHSVHHKFNTDCSEIKAGPQEFRSRHYLMRGPLKKAWRHAICKYTSTIRSDIPFYILTKHKFVLLLYLSAFSLIVFNWEICINFMAISVLTKPSH